MEISIRSQNAPKAAESSHRTSGRKMSEKTQGDLGGPTEKEGKEKGVRENGLGKVSTGKEQTWRGQQHFLHFLVKVLISCYMCQNFNDADKSCPKIAYYAP